MLITALRCAGLLTRSRENKEQYDKERLKNYYKKNYKVGPCSAALKLPVSNQALYTAFHGTIAQDYFSFEAGDPRTAKARGLSPEMQRQINEWIKNNP